MFTGLVETTGALSAREPRGPGFRLVLATRLSPLELGESIAVSGACLTVAAILPSGFAADVSHETVEKTTLGRLAIGAQVNLERSLQLGDRLGGHLVTGHVDGVARLVSIEPAGEARRIMVDLPPALLPFVAAKGSVALDGVSLTVNAVHGSRIELMLIPHTLTLTNLGGLRAGSELNLEIDLVARYVVRWLEASGAGPPDQGLVRALERAGFTPPSDD
jgi:riboflavin synthase